MTILNLQAGVLKRRGFAQSAFTFRKKNSSATLRAALDSKQHVRGSVRGAIRLGGIRIAAAAEAGNRMTIGGVASSVTPDSLLVERVLDPALPDGFAEIRRYRGARGEVTLSGITAFWQRHSEQITVRGLQVSTHSPPVPLLGLPALELTAGAARVRGTRGTKGWLALRWRP